MGLMFDGEKSYMLSIRTNKQTNRESNMYRGEAEGRQCRIAMLGGNAQVSDGDIRTQPVGYRGVLSLSQGEHEDTVEERE